MDTQMGPGIYGLRPYGPGTKVSWYLENYIRIYLAMAKTVANCLIAIRVPLLFSKSLLTIHAFVLPKTKAVAKLLIVIPVILCFPRITFDDP